MNSIYEPQNEKFYIRFWAKAEMKVIYKMIFALICGLCGALFAILMAVLMLLDGDFKWTLILIGFGFIVSIILSPYQYKIFSKNYREHVKFHESKNTQTFMAKIKK